MNPAGGVAENATTKVLLPIERLITLYCKKVEVPVVSSHVTTIVDVALNVTPGTVTVVWLLPVLLATRPVYTAKLLKIADGLPNTKFPLIVVVVGPPPSPVALPIVVLPRMFVTDGPFVAVTPSGSL